MLIFAVVSVILISAYLLLTVPYLTIDAELCEKKLTVLITAWFHQWKIVKDFSQDNFADNNKDNSENTKNSDNSVSQANGEAEVNETQNTPNNDSNNDSENDSENEEKNLKGYFEKLKARVFKTDTGFDSDEAKNVISELKTEFSYYWKLGKRFLSSMRYKISIPVWRITLDYGTADAALTGMLYGSAWSVLGFVYPLLARYARVVYPMLDITPDFYGKRFELKVKSIIKVRPAHIINAAVPTLIIFLTDYFKKQNK